MTLPVSGFGDPNVNLLENAQQLLNSGRIAEAIPMYQRVLQLSPNHPIAHADLALALWDRNDDDGAHRHALAALNVSPDIATAQCALGLVYYRQRKVEEAIPHLRRACELRNDFVVAHQHLGLCLSFLCDHQGALAEFERVLHIIPSHPHARFSRATSLLTLGRYEEGWHEYEWRWATGQLTRPEIPRPRWDGSPLAGRSLLVHTEQGIGDVLQFIRLLPLLKAHGCRLVFACQQALHQLLKNNPNVDEWMPIGVPAAINFDIYTPLMALPPLLKIREHNVPRKVPYVFADPDRIEHWRKIIEPLEGFKIGICWQGSPTYLTDWMRSFPLKNFEPIAQIPGVHFIALQKGHGIEQVEQLKGRVPVTILDKMDEGGGPFMDTAAIMHHLDLVIAPDSSISHLAGSMGIPIWAALSTSADWRWLVNREDTLWYPTMRLFRQTKLNDWSDVFARMAEAVKERIADKNPIKVSMDPVLTSIRAPMAPAELFDKLTILEIKMERITDEVKLAFVRRELAALQAARDADMTADPALTPLIAELKAINVELWDIEDSIRDCESNQDFGPKFIELARSVYKTNDRRAAVKRRINEQLGARIVEEKSYADYK